MALLAAALPAQLKGYAGPTAETQAASALFKQFETVAYTKSDFLSKFDDQGSATASEYDMRLPFLSFLGGLMVLGPEAVMDLEKGYSAVLVGAKDFTAPEGIGAVSSNSCYVAILDGNKEPDLEHDFDKAKSELISGNQVWTWSAPPYEGHPKPTYFYAAQVAQRYFVMTNSHDDFLPVVRALSTSDSLLPTSMNALNWETYASQKYWVFRSIGGGGLSADGSDTKELKEVIALTFYADADKNESFIRVLSSDKSMKSKPKVLPDSEMNRIEPQGAGIWQARIPLSAEGREDDPLFRVFSYFGFGVVL
jgi:hypothetical protein